MKLTEDDLYRTSTQYRNWSFTPAQLAAQRQKTNQQASERVRAAHARQRAQRTQQVDGSTSESERNGSGLDNGDNTPISIGEGEIDCLTVEEEMKLLESFCERTRDLGDFCKCSAEVTATCIQFLRRFYLFNSPMTYEGQVISRTAMFIANKAESHFLNVENFAASLGSRVTAEKILSPEYIIIQALRYNLDVRHPFRGLKGGHLELMELAHGNLPLLPNSTQNSVELQTQMQTLPRKPEAPSGKMTLAELEKRITDAYGLASHILKTAAQLTDAYFLYTPSQIWLSAHLLADEPLTLFYLNTKLPSSSPIYTKTLATLRSCADLLSSHRSFNPASISTAEKEARNKRAKEEVRALVVKLKHCRDPDKIDLVKLNQAQKRDAMHEGELEESKAKRRKLQREGYQKEANDFWGPALPQSENGAK